MQRVRHLLFAAGILLAFALPARSQSYTLVPFASGQYFTTSGTIAVCNGCLLNAYLTGSSTRRDTYSDTSGTVNANPVVLSSSGRATVYLAVGVSYRLVLTNSTGGTTYWDIDPVAAVPASAGNVDVTGTAGVAIALGEVVYLSDGTGSLTAGRWYLADADFTYASSTAALTGIATAAIASGASGSIRIVGRMTGLSGLTAGEFYYVSATAGALVTSPPVNQRFIGEADTTTTLVINGGAGGVRIPDSAGAYSLAFITTSTLTADRRISVQSGDGNRQITLTGDPTLGNNDTSTSGSPTFASPTATGTTTTNGLTVTGSTARFRGLTYTMPSADGAANAVLTTDGSLGLSWAAVTQRWTLLRANTGTSTAAGATNVDTVAISGLSVNDRIYVLVTQESVTQQTSVPRLRNETDSVNICVFSDGATSSVVAGARRSFIAVISQEQNAATQINAFTSGGDGTAGNGGTQAANSTFTTAWTGSWTLAYRHDGVTAGGTYRWTWAVYRIDGD